jgi:hypothetical protein
MLIQLLTQHPQALGTIVKQTPTWVWGLLAALLALGLSQLYSRQLTLRRVVILPAVMLGFGLYGLVSAFGNSGQIGAVLSAWLLAAAGVAAGVLQIAPPAGTRFDPASETFSVPGSVVPLLLILGIFMTKYIVGVELAMQGTQAHDAAFALPIALLYGGFNGIFTARALRLLRLSHGSVAGLGSGITGRLFAQRDPW